MFSALAPINLRNLFEFESTASGAPPSLNILDMTNVP